MDTGRLETVETDEMRSNFAIQEGGLDNQEVSDAIQMLRGIRYLKNAIATLIISILTLGIYGCWAITTEVRANTRQITELREQIKDTQKLFLDYIQEKAKK